MGSSVWIFVLTIVTILLVFGITALVAKKTIKIKEKEEPKEEEKTETPEVMEDPEDIPSPEDPDLIANIASEDDEPMKENLVEKFMHY